MKRHITPKVTTKMMLFYFILLVIDVTVYFVADWVLNLILNDPCSFVWVGDIKLWVRPQFFLFVSTWKFRLYFSLIVTAVPSVIVIKILVLEIILFVVVLKRSADMRKPFIAEKEQIDSINFTRHTLCIFAFSVKHVITSGPRTIMEMMFEFSLLNNHRLYNHLIVGFDMVLAINHSTNMFVYLIINPKFREELRNIFLLKRRTNIT